MAWMMRPFGAHCADWPGCLSDVSGVIETRETKDKMPFNNLGLRKWCDSRLLWERSVSFRSRGSLWLVQRRV